MGEWRLATRSRIMSAAVGSDCHPQVYACAGSHHGPRGRLLRLAPIDGGTIVLYSTK